jgi:hypothetical protein
MNKNGYGHDPAAEHHATMYCGGQGNNACPLTSVSMATTDCLEYESENQNPCGDHYL